MNPREPYYCGCGVELPYRGRGRRRVRCQDCQRAEIAAKKREYRQRNKEQIAARKREYRQRNKEQIAAKKREYYQRNKEQIA